MGGKNSGRRADGVRRRQAASLYARGLSLAQVGSRMGCSRQAVHQLLRAIGATTDRPVVVRCPRCGAVAGRLRATGSLPPSSLCLACLARAPDAPFADRLRACRVAAGLSLRQLARRSGIRAPVLAGYEAYRALPSGTALGKLMAALGPALVPGCERLPAAAPAALPARLRDLRRAVGLRQKDLAARCGLHPVQVNAYERGRRPPPWGPLCRLAAVLGPGVLGGR